MNNVEYYIGFVKDVPGDIAGLLMIPVEIFDANEIVRDDKARTELQRQAVKKCGVLIRILKISKEISL